MATLTTEYLREELKASEGRAAAAWATADKLRSDMIKEGADPSQGDNFAKVSEAFKAYDTEREQAEQLKTKLGELARIDGMYQGGGLPQGDSQRTAARARTMGARLVASEAYQRFLSANPTPATFSTALINAFQRPVEIMTRDELEAVMGRIGATTVTGNSSTSGGPFIQNDLMPGFVSYNRKPFMLANIVGQGSTDSDTVEYVTQSAVTNAAAETSEDVAAPAATYAFATATVLVQEITHYVPITLRAMADAGQLRTIVEGELAIDVLDRLDTQIATGNGTPPNLEGIWDISGTGTQPLGGDTRLDALHKAMTTVRTAAGVFMEPDYIVMHPTDWQNTRLSKSDDGAYLLGPGGMAGDKQVWGVPVIVSSAATAGSPMVGNFERGAKLWLREGLSVTAGLDGNDFTTRRISLLAAMRAAFKTVRPTAFCAVTGF